MKPKKKLWRVAAATAAAVATLLGGGMVASSAVAAEDGLSVGKTVTAGGSPNTYDVNLSATGRDYATKEHALFVLDRTGSVGQGEYDEIANMARSLGKRLMSTSQVQVSVVLFAGGAQEKNSVWYDGYEVPVKHSTNPTDLDKIMVPVSTTTHNGVFYGSEKGTNWQAAFRGAEQVMAHEQLPTDVFFFSDGHPNLWDNPNGDGTTPKDPDYSNQKKLSPRRLEPRSGSTSRTAITSRTSPASVCVVTARTCRSWRN